MAKARPRFVLIDAHALIHRAFHAIPFLATKDGELTNAVFGFTATVLSVIKELQPEYLAVSFDLPEPTFRHKQYKDYKATRQKAPDELRSQFGRVRAVVDALSMPVFEVAGYEADDVLGSLAKQYTEPGKLETYVVTGDKDMLQLIDDHVKIFTLRKGIKDTVIYDKALLKEEYGLTPAEFIEYKALKGDTSDNIPGVPGIGDKTAQTLVAKYRTLEGLYKALTEDPTKHPDIKPKVWANLGEFKDQAYLSRDLSRIVTDVKLKFDLEACRVRDFDYATAKKLFDELEFGSLLRRLGEVFDVVAPEEDKEAEAAPRDWSKKDYTLVDTEPKLKKFLKELSRQQTFAFDTETERLDSIAKNLVGLSFSWQRDAGYYLPVGHKAGPNLDLEKTLAALRPVMTDPKVGKVAHHYKYDYEVLRCYGLEVRGAVFDTMLGSYLLNPGARSLGLDKLAHQELGYEMQPITALIGEKKKEQVSFAAVPTSDAARYAAEDADLTWQLYEKLSADLAKTGVTKVLEEIELPLVPALAAMEQRGVILDAAYFETTSKRFGRELKKLEKNIHKMAGQEFNLNSPSQLSVVLYDDLGLGSGGSQQGKKHRSTAAGELDKLKDAHPIVAELLHFRELSKLKSTYLDALPQLIRPDTKRVHTTYSQTIAATGRLSSSDPNLQNIPIRTELGREIRRGFVTKRGWKLLSADYSQFELRIAAHISGDKNLAEKFRQGLDIHTATAAEVAGISPEEVKPEQRYAAKAVNFSILYGATPHGVARSTGLSRADATAYIEKYFATYPKLKEYMDAMVTKAEADGYVETLFGRRRYVPEIHASVYPIREAAKRIAINMPIQGTQADILKLAMIKIHDELPGISADAHMVLTVHDELVFEVPSKDVPKVGEFVIDRMENAYELSVPVKVEAKSGDNWDQMKPLN